MKVVDLTADTFEHYTQASTGQTTGKWFVKFYAPWCGHCKHLAPVWDELAKIVAEEDSNLQTFVIAKVDCTEHKAACTRFGVRGYPTLKLIANGQIYDYKGARKLDALTDYLKSGDFGEGNPVPPPPSFFMGGLFKNKAIQMLREDFDHIVSYRKNAAAVLLIMGVMGGVLLMVFLQMIFGGSKTTTKATTTKKND